MGLQFFPLMRKVNNIVSRHTPALFKRRCCHECGTVVDSGEATVTRGNLTLDRALRHVTWRGQPVHLTRQQFDVLELLVQREGRVVQSWVFFVRVFDEEIDDNQLAVLIARIRGAFRQVDPEFDRIATARGEGFRWLREDDFVMARQTH